MAATDGSAKASVGAPEPPDPPPWVALVGPEVEDNLGLRYLASALVGAGFGVEILALNNKADVPTVLDELGAARPPPMLVGVSLAFQWRALDVLALLVALRGRGYAGHVTAGGHFGSFARRELLADFSELDSICRYEAEQTIVELARALSSGGPLAAVPGLAFRGPAGKVVETALAASLPLEKLAWPDRRGTPACCLGHGVAPMVASRGCYANCAFCCIAAWHRQASGKPLVRLRPVADVAAEVAHLQRAHGIDAVVFHDDDFFLPTKERSLERIRALGAALRAEGAGRLATVVKARPNDLDSEVVAAIQDELGCIRLFLGIESNASQGLTTLRRGVSPQQNEAAMAVLAERELYVCFNLLVFDPDTTLETLETNLAFMARHADCPFNFGRVELYAGTPLLARMQAEGRCRGDYLGSDYRLGDERVQRAFELFLACFRARNFAPGALANRLMGTRFDVEMSRRFHPTVYRPEWLERSKALSSRLALGSVAAMRDIVLFVTRAEPAAPSRAFEHELARRLRHEERELRTEASALEAEIQAAVGGRCRHAKMATRLPAFRCGTREGILTATNGGRSP